MRSVSPVLLVLGACVDPLTSDAVVRPELLLRAGSQVESIETDGDKAEQIAANDGIDITTDPVVRASLGFHDGALVRWWDFGEASPVQIPLYLLVAEDEAGELEVMGKRYKKIGHPPIFDKVPGDAGYSPWWTVVLLPVSEVYDGELVTSFEAVEEAVRQGLVGAEVVTTKIINCPVVAWDARLERKLGEGSEPPEEAYYRGKVIRYFSFDEIDVDEPVIASPPLYELRREGGEPLSERIRGVDMTQDGDLLDTNDVFAFGPGDPEYTGFVRATSVVVAMERDAIDTTGNESESDFTSSSDLFDAEGRPRADNVVSVGDPGPVLNRPIARD